MFIAIKEEFTKDISKDNCLIDCVTSKLMMYVLSVHL